MQRPIQVLALCGLLTLVIYIVAFALPYSIYPLARVGSPADLGAMSDYSVLASGLYILAIMTLFALYWVAVRAACTLRGSAASAIILGSGILSALVLCQVYPFGATDVFLYIVRGRLLGLYGQNPLLVPPSASQTGAYLPFPSEWAGATSSYGPLWEWTAAALAWLGDGSLLRELLVFKGFGLLCYIGCLGLLWTILRQGAPTMALQGLTLFAWNPLVLLETLANGHNDLYMAFFLLLALWFWQRQRYALVLAALILGGLIKYVPLILLLPTLLLMARRLPRRDWLKSVVAGALISAPLTVLLFAPLWPGWAAWDLLRQMGRVHTSVGAWLIIVLQTLGIRIAFDVTIWSLRAVFVLLYLRILWQVSRGELSLVDAYHRTLYALLFYLALAFGYWYIVWLITLIPLLGDSRARMRTLLFGACGLLSVAIYTFGSIWSGGRFDVRQIHILAVPFVFGLPYLLASLFDRRLRMEASDSPLTFFAAKLE